MNALITVHQLSEDLPLSWLDTPYELPLPRHNSHLPPSGPNLGLVIIPSNVTLNTGEDDPPSETTITTYRLQPDLSVIGDTYGPREQEIQSFAVKRYIKGTETLSPRWSKGSEGRHKGECTSDHDNWEVDFSKAAEVIIPRQETTETRNVKTLPQ